MSTLSGPILLTSPSGEQRMFYKDQVDISGDYTRAEVLSSEPKSLWVVYTVTEWDRYHPGDRDVEKIVRVGHPVTTCAAIRSMQGFDETNPGIILFEHSQYRGFAKKFENSNPDMTKYFHPGQISGVSSMIITGGQWSFYTGFNFTNTKIIIDGKTVLGPGDYDLGHLPVNDHIKSIQYVQIL